MQGFFLSTKAPLLWPCHIQYMNIFGQAELKTDDQWDFQAKWDLLLPTLMVLLNNIIFLYAVFIILGIINAITGKPALSGHSKEDQNLGWPLGSLVCDVFMCFVTFQFAVLGQVWYLIVSILIFAFCLTFKTRYHLIPDKVLQTFCNISDLHYATICLLDLCFIFFECPFKTGIVYYKLFCFAFIHIILAKINSGPFPAKKKKKKMEIK